MASTLGTVETLMQCPICLEDFTDPRILPCLHTLCRKCLENHVSTSRRGENFTCPSCRHKCQIPKAGVPSIPKNFFLNSFKELLETQTNTGSKSQVSGQSTADGGYRQCDNTKFDKTPHEKATSFCANCAEFYCETCASYHSKFGISRDHKLIPASDVDAKILKGALKQAKIPHCDQHPDMKLHLYCDDCQVPVCATCYIVDHTDHTKRKIADLETECQKKVKKLFKAAALYKTALDKHMKDLEALRSDIQRETDKACQQVQQAANDLRDLVKKREKHLIQQIRDKEKAALMEVKAVSKETELNQANIQSLQSYMKALQESGNIIDLVVHTPGLQEQLRQQQAAPLKTVGLTVNLKKETKSVAVVDAMLGTVSTESFEVTTKRETDGGSDTDVVEMELGAPLSTLKHTVGNWVSGLVVLGDCVCATGWKESELWIHNTVTQASHVHKLQGLCAVGLTFVGKDTDNTLVISSWSSRSGSLHFVTLSRNPLNITRHTVKDITFQPRHISIHPVTGQLVIADYTNEAIVTCDTQGNILNSIKAQTDVGRMWCAEATDDGYVILDWSNPGRVHWVDNQGKVTHTYGKGHGLRYPCHMVRGRHGQLVVADKDNHRLHLVDASGQLLCYPLTQSDGIQKPWCVWLEEATSLLYVAHGSGVNYEIRVYKWPTALKSRLTGNATYTQHTLQLKLVRYK